MAAGVGVKRYPQGTTHIFPRGSLTGLSIAFGRDSDYDGLDNGFFFDGTDIHVVVGGASISTFAAAGTSAAFNDITGLDASLGIAGLLGVGAGAGGAVAIVGGASAGGTGTGGSVTIAPGAASGGTEGGVTICTSTTQKLAFHGSTPVAQQAGAAQAILALDVALTGADTVDLTALNADMSAIQTLVNEIRQCLIDLGLIKGAA